MDRLEKGSAMRRIVTVVSLVLFALPLLLVSAGSAGAGGFCADGNFSDARGTTVDISQSCFNPTVLRVDRGQEVTFVNNDSMLHMVGGVTNVFGNLHDEIKVGESRTYTFNDDGVFPYVCVLHPGMGGAIVVGDGEGKVTQSSVTTGSVSSDDSTTADAARVEDASEPAAASQPTSSWIVGLAVLLGLGLVGARWLPRRKAQLEA
jgi:plastocyanin